MRVTAIVLTLNEQRHLRRCLRSLEGVADDILVVDSSSTDETGRVAREHGATFVSHEWKNHATQFNWALSQLGPSTEWVLRVDADEYLTPELAAELRRILPSVGREVAGVYVVRRVTFQGHLLRYGGMFPVRVLRMFRHGRGRCEDRWMDEHIKVDGPTIEIKGELVDDNLNSLTWWTAKHNNYASREAVDLLNLEYAFRPRDSVAKIQGGSQPAVKRWLKEEVYARMPGGTRAAAYFLYRYVMRLGFLDGKSGTSFHFLQGFWYRYLVDAKVSEVKRYMRSTGCDAAEAIECVLSINVRGSDSRQT